MLTGVERKFSPFFIALVFLKLNVISIWMIRLTLFLVFFLLTLSSHGQLMEKSFTLKDVQRSHQLDLYPDGSFSEVTGNGFCECTSYSVGYYNIVGDTLMVIHRPYFQDSLKAGYTLRAESTESPSDSTRFNLNVFDIDSGEGLTALILTSEWEPGDNSNAFLSDRNRESTFYIGLDSISHLVVSDLAYDRFRIDLPNNESVSQIDLNIALPLRYRRLHTYYNEEYRVEKFLIKSDSGQMKLESVYQDLVLMEVDNRIGN